MNYKIIYKWILDKIENNNYKNINENSFNFINEELKSEIEKEFKPTKKPMNMLNEKYSGYFKKEFLERNKGLDSYSYNDLLPELQQQLQNCVNDSLALIKYRNEQEKIEVEKRFRNFIKNDLNEDTDLNDLKEALKIEETKEKLDKHTLNIIIDQETKMVNNLDRIVALNNGAIGCIWHTMLDIRVVGNPNGLYPKGTKEHGNHYKRQGVFFAYKSGFAYQQGLLKAKVYEDLEDGGVEKAINCRCFLENIYDLRDVPEEYLSKKGLKYINE